jgi:mandelamide amidase
VTLLLRRCREQADLNAFITIDENVVLEAAENADLYRKSNKTLGPLHGVPIAVKRQLPLFI